MEQLIQDIQSFFVDGKWQAYIAAVVIVIITAVVSRICTMIIRKLVTRDGSHLPSSSILSNTARVAIWIIGISFMLSACFKVNVSGLIAALGVGGIAISLGFQDTIKNFFGGMQITLTKIIEPGDHIIVGSTEGVVLDVTWRQTTVKDFLGHKHIIPNSLLSSNEVIKVNPANQIKCSIAIDNTGEKLNVIIQKMVVAAGTAIKKQAALKSMPWIRIDSIQQDTANGYLFFVLKDMRNVQDARDAAMRAIAPYVVTPYGLETDDTKSTDASGKDASKASEGSETKASHGDETEASLKQATDPSAGNKA